MKRFWKKVNKGNDDVCWEWQASRISTGYGQFWYKNKNIKAHRLSWILSNGSIPKNKCVLHSCDNPPCVNPKHLWLGSLLDNTRDMIAKGRQRYFGEWPSLKGEDKPNSKLKGKEVKLIRKLYKNKKLNTYQIAKKFHIGKSTAWEIIAMKKWTHI